MKVFSLLSTAVVTTCLTASGFCEEENLIKMDFRESQSEMPLAHQMEEGGYTIQDYSSSSQSNQMMDDQNGKRVMNSSHGCVDQGFSFQAEFIWWHGVMDNLPYTITVNGDQDTSQGAQNNLFDLKGSFKYPSFKFDPGVRLSAGYDFGLSNWDVFARWTYYYTNPTSSVAGDPTNQQQAIFVLRDFYVDQGAQALDLGLSASTQWQNQMNIADLEMGYDYFFSKRFSFRPYFGLKASWINMEFNTKYTNVGIQTGNENPVIIPNVSVRNRSSWWGIGPGVGMDGHLYIGWGFSLYGKVSGALMYGSYDSRYKQVDSRGAYLEAKGNSEYRQRAMSQVVMGLEWAKCFSNNMLLAFNLGWEGQYWWNQNQMHIILDCQPSGDLTLTGLDVGIRLDF